jgi:RimJ/RimL family protein N-acetyltransferase
MAPTSEQARIVAELKSGRPEFSLAIFSSEARVVGFLVPVTYRNAEEPGIVDALFRWRRAHMEAFLTIFTPSREKTRSYLTDFSLPDPARILFLAASRENRLIGHIGLCNIASDSVEIDNVLRGETVDCPGFMEQAHVALLGWVFSVLDVPLAYLNVLAHNARALRAYRKIGFKETARTPLIREVRQDGYRLRPPGPADASAAVATLVRMEIAPNSRQCEHLRKSRHSTGAGC